MLKLHSIALMGLLAIEGAVFAQDGVKLYDYPNYKVYSILDQTMTMPGRLFSSQGESVALENGYSAAQNVFLIENKATGSCALIDAGFGNTKSNLMPRLKRMGVSPDKISAVFITHIHPDHVGGLTTTDGKAAFPNAKVYIARLEYEKWQTDANRAALGVHIRPYGNRLILMDFDMEVNPYGLRPLLFKGHTPGHTVYELRVLPANDKKDVSSVFFVGDIVHAVDLQVKHPDYCARFDQNPAEAVAFRRALFRKAKVCFGAHITFPGRITIVKKNDAPHESFSYTLDD